MSHADNEKEEEKKQSNQESIRIFGEKNYKYQGLLEADTIKQIEMKEKVRKVYLWTRKFLNIKLCCRNFLKGINIG